MESRAGGRAGDGGARGLQDFNVPGGAKPQLFILQQHNADLDATKDMVQGISTALSSGTLVMLSAEELSRMQDEVAALRQLKESMASEINRSKRRGRAIGRLLTRVSLYSVEDGCSAEESDAEADAVAAAAWVLSSGGKVSGMNGRAAAAGIVGRAGAVGKTATGGVACANGFKGCVDRGTAAGAGVGGGHGGGGDAGAAGWDAVDGLEEMSI